MNTMPPDLPLTGNILRKKPLALAPVPAKLVPSLIHGKCAPFDMEVYGEGHHALYILPEAYLEFAEYVKFGKKRACNAHEQQYIGLGHGFIDTNNRIQIAITRIIPIYSASRGPTHAKAISENNDAVLDVLQNERQIQNQLEREFNYDENGCLIDPFLKYGPSKVMLFGHTHPGLGCFFSPVDHRSNYSTPTLPIVTFVCDPIEQDMKAMVGINCEDMKIIACRPKAAATELSDQRTCATREHTPESLWHKLCTLANMMLRQTGVNGSFDCHHDRRGRAHMQFHIVHSPYDNNHED